MNEQDEKTMNELLEKLAIDRILLAEAHAGRTSMLENVQIDPKYIALGEDMNAAKTAISQTEDLIRTLALTEYVNTNNKQVHEKVTVKVFKTFEILDAAAVRTWVDANLRDALIVDDRKIKDYATKIGAVSGTRVGEQARAEIASKL